MTDHFDDELSRRLADLDSEIAHARMPGATAARARATQRTRHQVTTVALAGVAAVAIGVVGITQPTFTTTPQPAQSDTITPVPTSPTGDDSAETVVIPPDALMTADDIVGPDGVTWAEAEPGDAVACVPVVDPAGLAAHERVDFASPDGDARVSQELFRGSPDVLDDVVSQVEDCVPTAKEGNEVPPLPFYLDRFTIDGVGDTAWMTRYFAEPEADGLSTLVQLAVTRQDDVVSLTVRTHLDTAAIVAPDFRTPAQALDRACLAIFDTDCVSEPVPVGLADGYPDLDGDGGTGENPNDGGAGTDEGTDAGTDSGTGEGGEPGSDGGDTTDPGDSGRLDLAPEPFLTDDQLNPIGSLDRYTANPAGEPAPYAEMCLEPTSGVGEDESLSRIWNPETEGQVDEIVLRFPDSDDASNWVLDHTDIAAKCPDIAADHDLTGSEVVRSDDAGEALVWSILVAPPDAGTTEFSIGVARRDNIVVVLTHWAMGGPDDWQGYVTPILETALDAAIAD